MWPVGVPYTAELAEAEAKEREAEAAESAALYLDDASSIIPCALLESVGLTAELAEDTTAARLEEAKEDAWLYADLAPSMSPVPGTGVGFGEPYTASEAEETKEE